MSMTDLRFCSNVVVQVAKTFRRSLNNRYSANDCTQRKTIFFGRNEIGDGVLLFCRRKQKLNKSENWLVGQAQHDRTPCAILNFFGSFLFQDKKEQELRTKKMLIGIN